jgi:ankyrin repeat protein
MVEYMINHGADVNTVDKYGITPLIGAVEINNPGMANLLIDKGANLNHLSKSGDNILNWAVSLVADHTEDQIIPLIALLIRRGAKYDVPNHKGFTAKDRAIKLRLGKVVQLMP